MSSYTRNSPASNSQVIHSESRDHTAISANGRKGRITQLAQMLYLFIYLSAEAGALRLRKLGKVQTAQRQEKLSPRLTTGQMHILVL